MKVGEYPLSSVRVVFLPLLINYYHKLFHLTHALHYTRTCNLQSLHHVTQPNLFMRMHEKDENCYNLYYQVHNYNVIDKAYP